MPFREPETNIGSTATAQPEQPVKHVIEQLVEPLRINRPLIHESQQATADDLDGRLAAIIGRAGDLMKRPNEADDYTATIASLTQEKIEQQERVVLLTREALQLTEDLIKFWGTCESSYQSEAAESQEAIAKATAKAERAMKSLGFDREKGPPVQVPSRQPGVHVNAIRHQFDHFVRYSPIVVTARKGAETAKQQGVNCQRQARDADAVANELRTLLAGYVDALRSVF